MTPRTTKPENTNKYYISSRYAGKKGWNPCILGNDKIVGRDPYLNVLPNCVSYCVGRFNEIVGEGNCNLIYILGGNNNAKHLIENAKAQGLEVGMEPKEGAIIVWTSSGNGHAAVVESLEGDGIRVSQSGWDTTVKNRVWFATHYKGDGNWIEGDDYKWMKGKYRLKGFIYLPEKKCPYAEPTKPFKKGAKGDNVRWLQWHLNKKGYDLEIDGSFGPLTDKATRDFQIKNRNAQAKGWVGPTTRMLLKR